ncbi:MAG: hypothetical protein ABI151_03420 [Chitinophagaceae bacterium]
MTRKKWWQENWWVAAISVPAMISLSNGTIWNRDFDARYEPFQDVMNILMLAIPIGAAVILFTLRQYRKKHKGQG